MSALWGLAGGVSGGSEGGRAAAAQLTFNVVGDYELVAATDAVTALFFVVVWIDSLKGLHSNAHYTCEAGFKAYLVRAPF